MAKKYGSRGFETATTTGTGAFTTAGARTGYQTLLAALTAVGGVSGDTIDYVIEAVDSLGIPTGDWEIGEGVVTSGNLTRETVYDNSLGTTALINFSAGDKYVFNDLPGPNIIAKDTHHTATENDDHALELTVNAAGFGDVKAIDIDYITGGVAATEEESIVLINIDEGATTGGTIHGFEVLSTTEGSAGIEALHVGIGIDPIHHNSGTFGNMDVALNKAADVLTALQSGGAGNISIFVADNDTFTIGDVAKFQEMEIILATEASGSGIGPIFEYSITASGWATFSPTDGTNGFKNSGVISWDSDDLTGWVAHSSNFRIRMTRTRNALTITPIIDLVQISAVTVYNWDKDGIITGSRVNIDADLLYLGGTQFGLGIANTFTSDQTFQFSDDGSGSGPSFTLSRVSASPAGGDSLGQLTFRGKNSLAANIAYGRFRAQIIDKDDGSEEGKISVITTVAGSEGTRGFFQNGIVWGSPTGGDKGTGTINAIDIFVDNNPVLVAGKHTIWIPAGAMIPKETTGAEATSRELGTFDIMLDTLNFDTTVQEFAMFMIAMPKSWNEGTVTFQPLWTAASGSGTAIFQLSAIALSDSGALDADPGGTVSSTDTLLTADDIHISPESSALTIAGTPAENDLVVFEIDRDIATDTLGVDAELIGIRLFITLNAGTDA